VTAYSSATISAVATSRGYATLQMGWSPRRSTKGDAGVGAFMVRPVRVRSTGPGIGRGEKPKSEAQAEAVAAKRRCRSTAGAWAHARRLGDSEGAIAELKCRRGMGRARRRGTAAFHEQLLIAAAAVNLRRLARWRPAASGAAAQGGKGIGGKARVGCSSYAASGATPPWHESLQPHFMTVTLCLN